MEAKPMISEAEKASSESNDNSVDELPYLATISETARFLRIGKTVTYESVRTGRIPAVRVGGQWRILRPALLEWLAQGGFENGNKNNTI